MQIHAPSLPVVRNEPVRMSNYPKKDILRQMKQINKDCAAYRELFTESAWRRKEAYHLCINTSTRERY